jgi:glycosyltransferase involved in cell wall biosynthesis
VLEAFASGTPVVTNALGIQGVEGAEPGRHHLQAETAAEIAQAAAELVTRADERLRLAAAASDLVRSTYSWEQAVQALLGLYGLARA